MMERYLRAAIKYMKSLPPTTRVRAVVLTTEPDALTVRSPAKADDKDAVVQMELFLGIRFAEHLLQHAPWPFVRGLRYALVKAAQQQKGKK